MRQGRSHRISSRELGLGDMVEGGDGGDVDIVRAGWGVEAAGERGRKEEASAQGEEACKQSPRHLHTRTQAIVSPLSFTVLESIQ